MGLTFNFFNFRTSVTLFFVGTLALCCSASNLQANMLPANNAVQHNLKELLNEISSVISQASANGYSKDQIITFLESKYNVPFSRMIVSLETLKKDRFEPVPFPQARPRSFLCKVFIASLIVGAIALVFYSGMRYEEYRIRHNSTEALRIARGVAQDMFNDASQYARETGSNLLNTINNYLNENNEGNG